MEASKRAGRKGGKQEGRHEWRQAGGQAMIFQYPVEKTTTTTILPQCEQQQQQQRFYPNVNKPSEKVSPPFTDSICFSTSEI